MLPSSNGHYSSICLGSFVIPANFLPPFSRLARLSPFKKRRREKKKKQNQHICLRLLRSVQPPLLGKNNPVCAPIIVLISHTFCGAQVCTVEQMAGGGCDWAIVGGGLTRPAGYRCCPRLRAGSRGSKRLRPSALQSSKAGGPPKKAFLKAVSLVWPMCTGLPGPARG